ncbi:hypothetical protein L1987_16266 [Smallanthus sonchifolius]|uniref:Uncharacterized protein n=1 Tax=Smallanthus sonchifolius TaxID=185202 RepID=A0ACB9J7S0_9ASTR|nr:hypothetical protein L1987_16266 [Smallanthus sonchifolius]
MSISLIFLLVLAAAVLAPVKASTDTAPGGALDDQFKCGGCPCNKPCYTTPPPPPPPPKKPSPTPGLNCPPPPSYIYMTGPPGNLYPVNPYSQSSAHRRIWVAQSLMVVVGVTGMLAFW